jgi:hypothetical protein
MILPVSASQIARIIGAGHELSQFCGVFVFAALVLNLGPHTYLASALPLESLCQAKLSQF